MLGRKPGSEQIRGVWSEVRAGPPLPLSGFLQAEFFPPLSLLTLYIHPGFLPRLLSYSSHIYYPHLLCVMNSPTSFDYPDADFAFSFIQACTQPWAGAPFWASPALPSAASREMGSLCCLFTLKTDMSSQPSVKPPCTTL